MKKILIGLLSLCTSASFALATPTQKLTVILDWFPNPDHAPLVVAQQQGYFKEQGLEVELIAPADPNDPPKWIAAEKADIGITYEPEFMQQIDRGLPLISIGTLIDKPMNCLVALKEGNIKSLADLKGKRIGLSTSGMSETMLRVMLEKNGLASNDVELINVRYNLTQALLSRRVDAVTGLMRNYEVPALELNDKKVSAFFPEEYGIPNYSELIFITNAHHAQDARLPKFLAAVRKAVIYLDAHPEDAWKGFIKQYPEANNSVNRESWFATLPYFAEEPDKFDHAEWKHFSSFMAKNKLIGKEQPVSKYIVTASL